MKKRIQLTESELKSLVKRQVKRMLMNEAWFGAESNLEETFNAISTVLKKMCKAHYIDYNSAKSVIATIVNDPQGRLLIPNEDDVTSIDVFWQNNGVSSDKTESNTGFLWSSHYGEANDFLDNDSNGAVKGNNQMEAKQLYSIISTDIADIHREGYLSDTSYSTITTTLNQAMNSVTNDGQYNPQSTQAPNYNDSIRIANDKLNAYNQIVRDDSITNDNAYKIDSTMAAQQHEIDSLTYQQRQDALRREYQWRRNHPGQPYPQRNGFGGGGNGNYVVR